MSIKKLVEELASIIPGFSGYYEMERRREEDKLLRDYLYRKIEEIEKKLNSRIKEITKSGELKELDRFSSLTKNIERIKDSVKYTSYGYKGFFDVVNIDEQILEDILNIDMDMIRKIVGFNEDMLNNPEILNDFFRDFEKIFNERREKILGVK